MNGRTAAIGYRLFTFLFAVVCVSLVTRAAQPATDESRARIRIVLAGDSTVARGTGWGAGFGASLTDRAGVTNLARGGRSSMSFINQGLWQKCLDLKPDYVLIQFGHNDQRLDDPARGTDPQTTYRKYMNQYVDDARAAGIRPILVTSLSRRIWGPDGKIHSNLQAYADVVKEIAIQKSVPLIDLHARSIELYEKLGKEEIDGLSPVKPSTAPSATNGTVIDATHLNARGSMVIGKIVAEEMGRAVPDLAAYVNYKESE